MAADIMVHCIARPSTVMVQNKKVYEPSPSTVMRYDKRYKHLIFKTMEHNNCVFCDVCAALTRLCIYDVL